MTEENPTPKPSNNVRYTISIAFLVLATIVLGAFSIYFYLNPRSNDGSNQNNQVTQDQNQPEQLAANEPTQAEQEDQTTDTKPTPTVTPTTQIKPLANTIVLPIIEKKPDLYVSEYSFNHDPETGKEFTVSIGIYNKGNAPATSFYWEWWPTHAAYACKKKIDGLPAKGGIIVKCDYTYASWSTYTTKVELDANKDVEESDETNNIKTQSIVPIHNTAKADLYISEYSFDHDPKQGEEFTVKIGIYNKGKAATGDFYWEWWPTTANYACREKIEGLPVNGGRIVKCTYTYGGWSTYTTKAVADTQGNVDESDESNNSKTQTVVPIH